VASFDIDPGFAKQLEWIRAFVAEEVEPLDLAFGGEEVIYDKTHPVHDAFIRPLQERVRAEGLWSSHLTPELGGQGYGQVHLAYMNEILGRSAFAPSVFGCQAPDSGNAEILAHYGTDEQKKRFLAPLLEGRISSCYSMTEPQGGADPSLFTTSARRDGDEWVIEGEKWFSSSFERAAFIIVMAVTDPDVSVYQGTSMFLIPAGTPGLEIIRHTGMGYDREGAGKGPPLNNTRGIIWVRGVVLRGSRRVLRDSDAASRRAPEAGNGWCDGRSTRSRRTGSCGRGVGDEHVDGQQGGA